MSRSEKRQLSPYFDIKQDQFGNEYLEVYLHGIALMRLVLTNKGTAFTPEERISLRLDGLLPPQVNTLEQQVQRVYRGYLRQQDNLAKYQFLRSLQERTEILFYALLERHLEEMLPIVYTPTIGQAVQQFSFLYQNPRGLSLSPLNIDRADQVLHNFPWNDVRMIVATDSSAILGIGDQGYGGLAIAIGKLGLYTVAGGVSPYHAAPMKLDVGTDRMDLINEPTYLGVRQRRLRGDAYYRFMDKFVDGVQKRWPAAVIQWEDFAKDVAFGVLERYRDRLPCFNDDIQGTGAVTLAGVLSACRMAGSELSEQRIVILGAGAAGIGVARELTRALVRNGLSDDEARRRVFVIDSRGLIVEGRALDDYKAAHAQPRDAIEGWKVAGEMPSLHEVIENAGATVLIGLSGQAGAFKQPMVEAMCRNTTRPVIFPLSNPTTVVEALPEEILAWSDGRAIVATGSPFPDVELDGKTYPVGQGNNAFIFPGLGFGTILCEASRITDSMVLEAACGLADYTAANHLDHGRVYPPVDELQEVSIRIAGKVIKCAIEEGVAGRPDLADKDLDAYLRSRFWRPRYLPVVSGLT